jgi:Tol biopolymer transport system component
VKRVVLGLVAALGLGAPLAIVAGVPSSTEGLGGKILYTSGSYVYSAGERIAVGGSPDWSPDGTLVAFARGGDLFVANADGSGLLRLTETPEVREGDPAWAPSGERIAFTRERRLRGGRPEREVWVVRADGRGARRLIGSLGSDLEPAWSPDGRRIAWVSTRDRDAEIYAARADGTVARRLTRTPGEDRTPAWSPDGTRIAFATRRDGNWDVYVMRRGGRDPADVSRRASNDRDPAWSPDGRRLAFSSDRFGRWGLYVARADGSRVRRAARTGREPDWAVVPNRKALLPDLDQRAPRGLSVSADGDRYVLAFTSEVDNVGDGPVWIRSHRPSRRVPTMVADQLVALSRGGVRAHDRVASVRYTWSPTHTHWHLLRFQRYELRRAEDFTIVVRDRKTGFCLADHYPEARGVKAGPPRFRDYCGQGRPDLLEVEQGSSVGYTDRYPANFHGQNLDITRVPAGRYVLVHRANPDLTLRERDYGNNAASALVRITRREGVPRVDVLALCPGSERCPSR